MSTIVGGEDGPLEASDTLVMKPCVEGRAFPSTLKSHREIFFSMNDDVIYVDYVVYVVYVTYVVYVVYQYLELGFPPHFNPLKSTWLNKVSIR